MNECVVLHVLSETVFNTFDIELHQILNLIPPVSAYIIFSTTVTNDRLGIINRSVAVGKPIIFVSMSASINFRRYFARQ